MSQRTQSASGVADEYGGSYLNNPEQQNRDLQSAHDMAILIQQMVRDRNGGEAGYRRAGELINETLDELSGRAPFGFVTPAFALGMTQVLMEKANTMDGPQFLQYMDGIRDRDNPLFFWQRSSLDPLLDEVKERTRTHVEEVYGRSTFTVFDALKGQSGPVAFSAGAADAVLDELGNGGRSMLLGAANPVEAGRQATELLRNLDRVPQALQQQAREAWNLVEAASLDDYHKGFLFVRVAITVLDAADVVEAGMSVANLNRALRNGEVHNIGDALRALDEGPQAMRQRGQAGDAPDLSASDAPGRARTPTASPSAQAAALSDQWVQRLPEGYREPYREAFTQLLRHNNYDTPEEVGAFARWLNDNPNDPVTRRYHEVAQETMQQRLVSAYPDRIESTYSRVLDEHFALQRIDTPQARMAFMQGLPRRTDGTFDVPDMDRRAVDFVIDDSIRGVPANVRDAYGASVASVLGENGYMTDGRYDPAGAQQYINNLAGAPGGPSAMEIHNRAMNVVVNTATDRFPDGTEGYYARAYRQTFEAENIGDPSAAQRYIDNLNAAPNGPAMRAVHDRATASIVHEQVEGMPPNVQAAYSRALRLTLDQAGADTPSEALTYVRNLTDGRQVQSLNALHHRAFDSVIESAVSSIDEPSRAAYRQALRESLDASGNGPARDAQGRASYDFSSVENAQRYVINLATSPEAMQRIHDRAGEIPGVDRTPDRVTQTPPAKTVNPPNDTQRPPQTPPADRVDPPGDTQAPPQSPSVDRVNPPNDGNPPNNGDNPPPNDRQTSDQALLNPSSQPNDPLLPFHAIERDQRMRPPEPLVSPDGQRFDVIGVERGDDGGLRVRLRPEGQRVDALPAEAMFDMRASTPQALAQPGNAVMHGHEPWLTAGVVEPGQQPGVGERSYLLRDPQNPERTTLVPESRASEIVTPVGREVTYQDETWRFQALQSPGWQLGVDRRGFQLVDPKDPAHTRFVEENRAVDIRMRLGEDGEYRFGDVRHGVIRMRPMEPDRDFTMALTPGMSFEARLRDREMEGPYRITVGDNGELTATGRIRNGTEVTQRIEPSDIAPRYAEVRSPDFNDSFQVDSFIHREANTRNRAISTEPTGLPLRDPAFGTLDGSPSPQLALGAQSLDTQADFIRRNAGNLDPGQSPSLTVFNIAFNNQGEARQVLDAMRDFRQMHPDAPIRIVAYEASFRSFEGKDGYDELQRIIQRDRVQVEFFGNDPAQREVIHAKGVVVNDQVLFSTGAVIDGSRNKADISVQLPPDGARAFNAYLNEAVIGDAGIDRRQQLAADAAREGVLINDPDARLPYIARAQDGLIRGAERELTVSVSELRNPDTTRAVIERAEAGVNVQVQFREMDPESRQLLADAQQRLPNLRVEDVSAWQPRPHYNVIVADREQAYVGTAYLWQNQQDMLQHGRSFENGVLLQGDAVRQLQGQMEGLRSLQPDHPGQRLLNPAAPDAPDVGLNIRNQTTGSISISAPAGSSIGVQVENSVVNGAIQTASGTGNVQVAGDGLLVDGRNLRPDVNGNVQVADDPGLRITLNNPGTSGNADTMVRLDGSRVEGSVQSVIGTDNVQISGNGNEVRVDAPAQDRGTLPDAGSGQTPIRVENDQTLRGEISNGNNNVSVVGGDNTVDVQQPGAPVRDDRSDRSVAITGSVADSAITTGNENVAVIGSENRVSVVTDQRQVAVNGSDIRVEPALGSLQSITGNRNTQIDAGEAQINGDRRQAVTGGDDNRQTQNLGANVTAESVTQTIDGRTGSRQQIGDDVLPPVTREVPAGGTDPRATGESERKLEVVEEREIRPARDGHLNGQSVAYTPRFSTQHELTGDGAGTYTTISGHGVLETDRVVPVIGNSVQRDSFVVPEGVNLHFLGLPGGVITDRLGQRADVGGDLSGVPLLRLGAGDTAPDILITPAFGTINIQGNPITVDNPQGMRLSQLIRDHDLSGNIVVSACLQQAITDLNREKWNGITFDLPERYPQPDPPNLSSPSVHRPQSLPIDPNFNTQHGLTNSGEGQYTAIGGNAALSGVNPYTQRPFAEQTFTVPEGVTVYFPSLPGGIVHNRLAETIEKGEDLSRIPLLKVGAGSTAPDPLLLPGTYEVAGNFVRIDDHEGRRLSEVIREHGLTGNVVVAAGQEGRNRPHSGVLFDLPEHYPDRDVRGGTRSFDLTIEQVVPPPRQTAPEQAPPEQAPPEDQRRSALPPAPPQPSEPGYEAYAQSRGAVERLNAAMNIPYGEPSERLTVAAATVAVEQRLRVDEVALNPPSATMAGGTTAFVIERGDQREGDRYGTVPVQVAMQTPLEEGYRRLSEVAEQSLQQGQQAERSQQQALAEEQHLGSRRMTA